MPFSLLPSLLSLILAVGYTPGPANIYAFGCAMEYGRKAAFRMWTGMLAGFTTAVLAMAVLTHLIGGLLGSYVVYIKYIGAAYILYLAWKLFSDFASENPSGSSCTFMSGFLVQLTNVKILLFDLTAFSTFVLPYSSSFSDLLKVSALLELAGPGANLVWILLGSWMSRFFKRNRKVAGTILSLCLAACSVMICLA